MGVELVYDIPRTFGARDRSYISVHFGELNVRCDGVYNMFVMCEIVCLVSSIGESVEH